MAAGPKREYKPKCSLREFRLLSKIWFKIDGKKIWFLIKLIMSPLSGYRHFVGHVLIYRKHVDLERKDG